MTLRITSAPSCLSILQGGGCRLFYAPLPKGHLGQVHSGQSRQRPPWPKGGKFSFTYLFSCHNPWQDQIQYSNTVVKATRGHAQLPRVGLGTTGPSHHMWSCFASDQAGQTRRVELQPAEPETIHCPTFFCKPQAAAGIYLEILRHRPKLDHGLLRWK